MPPPSTRRNAHRPSTRRQPVIEAEEVDLRPVGADGSRPPQLDLQIVRRLKILLLANVIPISGMAIIGYLVMVGRLEIKGIAEDKLWSTVLVVLIATVVCGMASWVLLPLSRWLCNYPRWYFIHQSRAIWVIPLVCGYFIRILIWILSVALIGFSLWMIGSGIWSLIDSWLVSGGTAGATPLPG